jgi:hypothetical protein
MVPDQIVYVERKNGGGGCCGCIVMIFAIIGFLYMVGCVGH